MGSQQSKQSSAAALHEKAVLQRLQSLQLDKLAGEEDYVHVENEKTAGSGIYVLRGAEGLNISAVEEWQSTLLKDPKNRCA